MKTRSRTSSKTLLCAAALLPLLAVPALSHADADQAFDACIKAFITTRLEKDRPVTVKREDSVSSPIETLSRTQKITLTAVGKESGKRFAKATCVADRNGTVLSLNGKSFATPALALADAQASTR
jgi:hypothetical protein